MGIKAGVKKRDRYPFAGKSLVGIEADRRRENIRAVLLHRGIMNDLVLCSCEKIDAPFAYSDKIPKTGRTSNDQFRQAIIQ